MNIAAVDAGINELYEVKYPSAATSSIKMHKYITNPDAPEIVKKAISKMIAFEGDDVPVSWLPDDGVYPTGTSQYEKETSLLPFQNGILRYVSSVEFVLLFVPMQQSE